MPREHSRCRTILTLNWIVYRKLPFARKHDKKEKKLLLYKMMKKEEREKLWVNNACVVLAFIAAFQYWSRGNSKQAHIATNLFQTKIENGIVHVQYAQALNCMWKFRKISAMYEFCGVYIFHCIGTGCQFCVFQWNHICYVLLIGRAKNSSQWKSQFIYQFRNSLGMFTIFIVHIAKHPFHFYSQWNWENDAWNACGCKVYVCHW